MSHQQFFSSWLILSYRHMGCKYSQKWLVHFCLHSPLTKIPVTKIIFSFAFLVVCATNANIAIMEPMITLSTPRTTNAFTTTTKWKKSGLSKTYASKMKRKRKFDYKLHMKNCELNTLKRTEQHFLSLQKILYLYKKLSLQIFNVIHISNCLILMLTSFMQRLKINCACEVA